jgi:hypothetical protein
MEENFFACSSSMSAVINVDVSLRGITDIACLLLTKKVDGITHPILYETFSGDRMTRASR